MKPTYPKIAAFLLASLLSFSAKAGLSGDTVQVTYWYPDIGVLYGQKIDVVPFGQGVYFLASADFGVYDNEIVVNAWPSAWTPAVFNGIELTDLTKSADFTSFFIKSITGAQPDPLPALSFDANHLFVNFTPGAVANKNAGEVTYVFGFTTRQSVPETPSRAVAWLALAGVVVLPALKRSIKPAIR